VPKIVVIPHPYRKQKQSRQERRNVFSDATNLFLLRLLRGKSDLPDTLDNVSAFPGDLQLELAAAIRQRVLPWFWSIVLHVALLIPLALNFLPGIRSESLDVLFSAVNFIPFPQEVLINAPPGIVGDGNPNMVENGPPGQQTEDIEPTGGSTHSTPVLGYSMVGSGGNGGGGGGGGGGGQPDDAVLAGLRWLVKVQQPDGAWHFSGTTFPQSAPKRLEDPLAATAMALLAFHGYGVTSNSRHPLLNEFARPVRRGWEWLLKQQNPDGSFFTPSASPNNHRFYTHGFCTIALCELLAMTREESLREPAQKAIDYCVRHQSIRRGGWRYLPDRFSEQSDVSVTGWIVLALKSGQAAGLTVPPETYDNVMKFFDLMMVSNQYRYREEEPEPRIAMTAEALFCRILLGWKRNDWRLAAGVQLILDTPPSSTDHYQRDVYYWFFATQTLYHYGGNEWQTWHSQMRKELLQHQEKDEDMVIGGMALRVKGSWNPHHPVRDQWGAQYGRLYTTCMSLYILEVPYRHLRIFP